MGDKESGERMWEGEGRRESGPGCSGRERGEERVDQGVVGGGKSEIEPLEMAVCTVNSKQTESEHGPSQRTTAMKELTSN